MTKPPSVGTLILVRHGQSTANQDGTFTGILDVDLTPLGCSESRDAGERLKAGALLPDAVFTSTLRRAIDSTRLILDVLGSSVAPKENWRLNERNYGALTGRTKSDVLRDFGREQLTIWRRMIDGTPPPLSEDASARLRADPPFSQLPAEALIRAESLRSVISRVHPFLEDRVMPRLRRGNTVLVVAHGNSLRAVCAILDDLTDEEVRDLNIPTGQPLLYTLAHGLRPAPRGGHYLDPVASTAAALALASQGGT